MIYVEKDNTGSNGPVMHLAEPSGEVVRKFAIGKSDEVNVKQDKV